jgi:hypothetical protein
VLGRPSHPRRAGRDEKSAPLQPDDVVAGAAAWNELVRGARRYYWVMPHMNLRRLGLLDMQEALRTGAAEGLRNLLGIALPSAGEDDPLRELAERALAQGD